MPHKSQTIQLPYSGFVLAFEPKRTEKVAGQLYAPEGASESFSAMDWKFERREIAFLILDRESLSIGAAVLMERMHGSGGTGKLKMRLSDPVIFERPIDASSVKDIGVLPEYMSTAEQLKRLDPKRWDLFVASIRALRPESAEAIDILLAKRKEERRLLGDTNRIARLMEQRDAVGVTLELGGLDRKTILRSLDTARVNDAKSILDLLDAEPLQEQDAIRHDQEIFKGLLSRPMRSGLFANNHNRSVRIHVYDKKRIETALGIDLLVYQESYRSFILIQYKMMGPISTKNGRSWSYLVDKQLDGQIKAMSAAQGTISTRDCPPGDMWHWRLNGSPFYMKFCEPTRPSSHDGSLIPGLTLNLEHLQDFLSMKESEGHAGGRRVGYENCPRYLNNSEFIEMARGGWIGCDRRGYEFICDILRANQAGNRIAMFAVVEGSGAPNAVERGWRSR